MAQIQKIEKFSEEGKEGRRVAFRFTTNNNLNGVGFNSLAVFTPEAVSQAKYDYNHDRNYERFCVDSNSMTLGEPKIEGTNIVYDAEYRTTDPEAVKVIDSEEFNGFSSNLIPLKDPIPDPDSNPRFYQDGGLGFESWTLLEGPKNKPAFVGAGDLKVEKFSVAGDVVLIETFAKEEKPTEEPKSETEEPKESQPAQRPEQFALSWVEIGEYIKVRSTGQIGRVEKVEKTANGHSITIRLTDGTETSFSEVETTDDRALDWISVSDVMDFILKDRGVEGFSATNQDDPKNDDQEDEAKQKEMNQKLERFDANLSKAKEMAKAGKSFDANLSKAMEMVKAGKTEKFTKGDPVENEAKSDSYHTKLTINNIV